jgi:hypothetical protein
MRHLINLSKFIFENSGCAFASVNDEEYEVFPEKLVNLLSFVGEGVSSVFVTSVDARHNGETYWTNTASIEFSESAHGGIELDDWNKAEKKLRGYIGSCGVADVSIDSSHNRIEIEFNQDKPLAGKDWHRQ